MMAFLIYLQLFASYFCSILLVIFPGLISYRNFVLLLAILTLIFDAWYVLKNPYTINKSTLLTFALIVLVIMLYRLTSLVYGVYNSMYESEFLVLVAQTIPSILTISLVYQDKKIIHKLKKESLFVGIIFSLVSFYVALNPTGTTSGGLVTFEEANLNYQNISYIAAFSSGLLEYSLLNFGKKKISKMICLAMIFANLFTILKAGGRGAFICYIAFSLISVYVWFIRNKRSLKYFAIFSLLIGMGVLILFLNFQKINLNSIEDANLKRIVGIFTGDQDVARNTLALNALDSFSKSWLFGNGFGSVFYEVGFYSHNVILDFAVETGLIGVLILVVFIFKNVKTVIYMIKKDGSDSLWLFLFTCGFVMALFSGYTLISNIFWVPLFFLFFNKKINFIKSKKNSLINKYAYMKS